MEAAYEAEAAGFRLARGLQAPATVLIGDFGGGTSDFSLLRFDPGAARPVVPLASTGVGVGGDISSALAIPAGCRFHPRCPYAMPACREVDPALTGQAPRHSAACHPYGTEAR